MIELSCKFSEYIKAGTRSHFTVTTNDPGVIRRSDGKVSVYGTIGEIVPETNLLLKGDWEENDFIAAAVYITTDTADLSCDFVKKVIKHIKKEDGTFKVYPKFSSDFVSKFGPDVISYVSKLENPDELIAAFPKIDPEKITQIFNMMRKTVSGYELIPFFSKYAISLSKVNALAEKYGASCISLIKSDPYKIGESVNLTFNECDIIAKDLGFDAYNDSRIKALVSNAYWNASYSDGSTALPSGSIAREAKRIANYSAFPEYQISDAIVTAEIENNKRFNTYTKRNYLEVQSSYYAKLETKIALELDSFDRSEKKEVTDAEIRRIEDKVSIKYSDGQKDMLRLISSNGIKIVTGGPGAGKTTGVNGIIRAYKELYPGETVKLCAPTGRAARRMSELTGEDAFTIHKTINLLPYAHGNIFNGEITQNIKAGMFIVDEFSMVDEELFYLFLKSINKDSVVILVGDENQLPSVAPGAVLRDIIASKCVSCVRLDGSYRSSSSILIGNAYRILNGDTGLLEDKHYRLNRYDDDISLSDKIIDTFFKNYSDADPFLLQVLTTTNKGPCGTRELNRRIMEKLYPGNKDRFVKEERVLFTKNNLNVGYVNGDIGIITAIENGELHIEVNREEIIVSGQDLNDIVPSYVMTIHKSQGSEFKNVFVVLPERPKSMLSRNLFYTAVTRSKENVCVMYTEESMNIAIYNRYNRKRITNLEQKLTDK